MGHMRLDGRVVLVVDDDGAARRAVVAQLREAGFRVRVQSGESFSSSAIDRADVVVTEIFMPGMDGFEVLRAVRRRRFDMPVIALSAGHPAMPEALKAMITLGACAALAKPVEPAALVGAVAGALSRLHVAAAG